METPIYLPENAEIAHYKPQRNPRFQGVALIEALPLSLSELELHAALEYLPPFDPLGREWEAHERMHELMALTSIMVPLEAHIKLARAIDGLMRQGYVGRKPRSAKQVRIHHDISHGAQMKLPFRQTASTVIPQLSTALVGVSGQGKTTTAKRYLAQIPQVIYHPELDFYQVTWLHFEMPSDGKGEKALAIGIIRALDKLLPHLSYYERHVEKSYASGPVMLRQAAHLLNTHCVGLLIPDEIQNISNTRKEDQVVMTELTSLCNTVELPILFIGTNKAEKILGLDFRQARRSLGFELGEWGPMPRFDMARNEKDELVQIDGEWVALVQALWTYQWVKNPVKLTTALLDSLYKYTQGIIDLVIKLFILVQVRAILDGSEMISEQLIHAVYRDNMKLVHPMVEALQKGDMKALMKFEDIKPKEVDELVNDMKRAYKGRAPVSAASRPAAPDFEVRIVRAAQELGMTFEDATACAKEIAVEGKVKNLADAMMQLAKKMSAPQATKAPKTPKSPKATNEPRAGAMAASNTSEAAQTSVAVAYADRPSDYRRAIVAAANEQTSIFEQLLKLGLVPELEDVLSLD